MLSGFEGPRFWQILDAKWLGRFKDVVGGPILQRQRRAGLGGFRSRASLSQLWDLHLAEPCLVPANIVLLVWRLEGRLQQEPRAGPWGSHMARPDPGQLKVGGEGPRPGSGLPGTYIILTKTWGRGV